MIDLKRKVLSFILSAALISSSLCTFALAQEPPPTTNPSPPTFVAPTSTSLGDAANFSVFAKEYKSDCDMEGNVAVGKLTGAQNLGNSGSVNIANSKDNINYVKSENPRVLGANGIETFRKADPLILGSSFIPTKDASSWLISNSNFQNSSSSKIGTRENISNIFTCDNYIDFDSCFASLLSYSKSLQKSPTVQGKVSGDKITFNCSSGMNFIDIPVSEFKDNNGFIEFQNLNEGDKAVINVTGLKKSDSVVFNKAIRIPGNDAAFEAGNGRVIFNLADFCGTATFIESTKGMILAPKAKVIVEATHDGNVIADNVNNTTGEIHKIPYEPPKTPPTPQKYILSITKYFDFETGITTEEEAKLKDDLVLKVRNSNKKLIATLSGNGQIVYDPEDILDAGFINYGNKYVFNLNLKNGGTYAVEDIANAKDYIVATSTVTGKGTIKGDSPIVTAPDFCEGKSSVEIINSYSKIQPKYYLYVTKQLDFANTLTPQDKTTIKNNLRLKVLNSDRIRIAELCANNSAIWFPSNISNIEVINTNDENKLMFKIELSSDEPLYVVDCANAQGYVVTPSVIEGKAAAFDDGSYKENLVVKASDFGADNLSSNVTIKNSYSKPLPKVNVIPTSLRIKKVSSGPNKIPLPGAEFTLYSDSDCQTVVEKKSTNTSGFADFKNITDKNGTTLFLKETKAPEGYDIDKTLYVFNLTSKKTFPVVDGNIVETTTWRFDGQTSSIMDKTIENTPKIVKPTETEVPTSLTVKKVSSLHEDETLADAEFTLYRDKDCKTVAAKKVTNDKGYALFDNLTGKNGSTLYLKETKAPKGYDLNNTLYEIKLSSTKGFTVVDGERVNAVFWKIEGQTTIPALITVSDCPTVIKPIEKEVSTSLTVKKVSSLDKNKALPEAEFTLYSDKVCKNEIAKKTTDENGSAVFDNLTGKNGATLYLKETKAPKGFKLNDSVYEFKLNSTSVVIPINDINVKTTTWYIESDSIVDNVITISNTPEESPPKENIPDEEIPKNSPEPQKVANPKTGSTESPDATLPFFAALSALSGLTLILKFNKKRKEEN